MQHLIEKYYSIPSAECCWEGGLGPHGSRRIALWLCRHLHTSICVRMCLCEHTHLCMYACMPAHGSVSGCVSTCTRVSGPGLRSREGEAFLNFCH